MIGLAPPPQGPVSPARTPDVVVVAPRSPDLRTLERQAEAITPALDDGFARRAVPVCPQAKGFPRATAAAIEQAVRAAATEADIAVARPGCTPDLTVMLVADGAAVVRAALRTKPALFDGVSSGERAALARVTGPARAWSTIAVRGAWDDPIQPGQDEGPPVLRPGFQSRVRATIRHDLAGTTILVDATAAAGRTVDQLAGYVAMRGLAGATPPARPAADTILSLFDAPAPPAGLTGFDRAYLRALYRGPANYLYHDKMAAVAASVHQRLAADPPASAVSEAGPR